MSSLSEILVDTVKENHQQNRLLRTLPFLLILIELSLIFFVVRQYQVEQELGFPRLVGAVCIGALINQLLPLRYRLPFFVMLFAVTLVFVTTPRKAAAVVLLSLGLIGVCHLPVRMKWKVAMVLMLASVLAAIRMKWIDLRWGDTVVPLIGSMFMFRLILYLFEMRKGDVQAGWWQRLAYFFLLPNICFPLFPIIDYRTFLRSYYNEDPYTIYQKGIRWMVWGIVQLLIYRVIYYYWVPAPSDVNSLGTLVLYFVTGYMLLLKIAGQAYLVLGILCLFGWNLPRMFHLYFLASGFSDLWRRVNLYWKEFMMKIFYYPVYFALRNTGLVLATLLSLVSAFFLTWILHSYQYFWIQGSFPITAVDAIFWGIFGISVAVDSVIQLEKKGAKSIGQRPWKFLEAAGKSLRVIIFFSFMCMLFSFWGSGSVSEWLAVVFAANQISWGDWGILVAVLLAAIAVGAALQHPFPSERKIFQDSGLYKGAVISLAALAAMLFVRNYYYYTSEDSPFRKVVGSIERPGWNLRDVEVAERGYYDPLLRRGAVASDVADGLKRSPRGWVYLHETEAAHETNNLLGVELLPRKKIRFRNMSFTTNSHGLRDKEYALEKPAGTYRFALLGSSSDMGNGVGDTDTYESIVEQELNKHNANDLYRNFEILNFSMNGYDFVRYVKLCDLKVFQFHPDAVITVGHPGDSRRVVERVVWASNNINILEFDTLKNIARHWGFRPGMDRTEASKLLLPYGDTILEWALNTISKKCREHNAIPIYLLIPLHDRITERAEYDTDLRRAAKAGFITIDLSDIFKGYSPDLLQIKPWDTHLNASGHKLVAEALYNKIIEMRNTLGLAPSELRTPSR
jgi:alginate O-acetyltransferase complex protein AlgI